MEVQGFVFDEQWRILLINSRFHVPSVIPNFLVHREEQYYSWKWINQSCKSLIYVKPPSVNIRISRRLNIHRSLYYYTEKPELRQFLDNRKEINLTNIKTNWLDGRNSRQCHERQGLRTMTHNIGCALLRHNSPKIRGLL